jgi:hypothetical protein
MNHFALFLSLLSVADAFRGLAPRRALRREVAFLKSTMDPAPDLFDPMMSSSKLVDMTRAHECAEHFGKCPVNEIQDLRDRLHKQRMQRFLFADAETQHTAPIDDSFEYRVLEEELDLQLSMLRQEESNSKEMNLFPEVESMEQLPHLTDHTVTEQLPHLKDHTVNKYNADIVHKAEETIAWTETVFEESVLETIAVCAAIALLFIAPQLL